jgi:hypothetical protein
VRSHHDSFDLGIALFEDNVKQLTKFDTKTTECDQFREDAIRVGVVQSFYG